MHDQSLAGQLLIATPLIATPPFARSVVFIGEHDAEGALGLILNTPSLLTVNEVLPGLTEFATQPANVHLGGPVQTDTAIVLAKSDAGIFARDTALVTVGVIDPMDPPADTAALRVYAGFSGWDGGQLEQEIRGGSWWSTPARSGDVFTSTAGTLWEETVRRLRGTEAFYATYPDAPFLN